MTMAIEAQRTGFYLFVEFSVSVALKLRTEILSDWISVVKPSGVLGVNWKLQGAS
jgi:hypothetical protein